jgi:hypothetical protein
MRIAMKNFIIFLIVIILLCSAVSSTYAFRCGDRGNNLARERMHKYQILKDCGPPISREIIGFDKRVNLYRIIEEWVYVIDHYGNKQMYLLNFNGEGILVDIEWLGEQE